MKDKLNMIGKLFINGEFVGECTEVEVNYETLLPVVKISMPKKLEEKPPLGLMPRNIHESQRIGEILEAMQRYNEAGKPIPAAWVEELRDLNQRQHEIKVQGSVQTIIDEIQNISFGGGV
jgi:hypothetical protein